MGQWRSHQCKHTGKLEHNGKFYCALHHPPTVNAKSTAKLEARNKEWDDKRKAREAAEAAKAEMARRAELYPEMLNELIEIAEWARVERAPLRPQEIDSILRLIAKATGEQA
jgi:uncharacterized Zn finger protein (UPF0148 family)